MSSHLTDLPWTDRPCGWSELGSPAVLYEDELPLSDVTVSDSGATCCLRREPNKAEVLVWPGLPSGPPTSWSSRALPLLGVAAFDGEGGIAFTRTSIVRFGAGGLKLLHEPSSEIRSVAVGPGQKRLLWVERSGQLRTVDMSAPSEVNTLALGDECLGAVWLPDGRLLAATVASAAGVAAGMALITCNETAEPLQTLLATKEWLILSMASSRVRSECIVSGVTHEYPQADFARAPGRPRVGTWLLEAGANTRPLLLSSSGYCLEAGTILGTYLFCDAGEARADSSTLIAATKDSAKAARVPAYMRQVAVHGTTLLYPTLTPRFTLSALPLANLLS